MKMRAVFLVAIAAYGLFSCTNAEDIVVPKTVTETSRFRVPSAAIQGTVTQSYVSETLSGTESTPISILPSTTVVFDTIGTDTVFHMYLDIVLAAPSSFDIPLIDTLQLRVDSISADSTLLTADNRIDGLSYPAGRVHVVFSANPPMYIDPFVGEPINHIVARTWYQSNNTLQVSLYFESDNGTLTLPDPGRLIVDGLLTIDLTQAGVIIQTKE